MQTVRFVLPDSKREIEIHRVSMAVLDDARQSMWKRLPIPEPPIVEVNYGDEKKMEQNPNDPDYKKAVEEVNAKRLQAWLEILIKLCVKTRPNLWEIWSLRSRAQKAGIELPKDNLVLYVSRILVTTEKDLTALAQAIIRQHEPTEEGVAKAASSFPGKTSR